MRKLLHALTCLVFSLPAISQMTAPQSGSIFETASLDGSDKSWIDLGYASGTDHHYASFGNLKDPAGNHTNYLVVTGFKCNVPPKAKILGIVATVECTDPYGGTSDYSVRIVKDNVISGSEHSSGALYLNISDRERSRSYGSSNDLWNEVWTVDDINSEKFGIAIAAQRAVNGAVTGGGIDNITLTIYYSSLATLPLTLTSFSGTAQQDKVRLAWSTGDESAMDRFELQRSDNNSDFASIGTVLCNNRGSSYAFTDYSPVSGKAYYRLKIVAKDGSITYSKTVIIDINQRSLGTIYPSPWKKGAPLYIHNETGQELKVRFYDHTGQMIGAVTTSTAMVPTTSLPSRNAIIRYQVTDKKEAIVATGSLMVY